MQLDEIQRRSRELFRLEATDLLRELEASLLALESAPADLELIGRVFRVMHTLKGSGATAGFQALSDFVHHVEEVFNAAREGRLPLNTQIIDQTLRIGDTVSRYLAADESDADAVLTAAAPELAALLAHLGTVAPKPKAKAAPPPPPARRTFQIHFTPQSDIFCSGFDPAMFLDGLRALGPCTVTGNAARLPVLPALDPELCYVSWTIEVTTAESEESVRGVFMFIEDSCRLTITSQPAAAAPAPPAESSTETEWIVEFQTTAATLAAPGALDGLWRDLDALGTRTVLASPTDAAGKPCPGAWRVALRTGATEQAILDAFIFLLDAAPRVARAGSVAARAAVEVAAPPPVEKPDPAPAPVALGSSSRNPSKGRSPADETLRVSAHRLDQLVNLVGQLVILRSQVGDACAQLPKIPPSLQSASEALLSLSAEMRDVVLHLRMMPIEETFTKFRRLVRDLSRELGKEVDLVIEGGETEMDKTMLEALNDPLMHLVRNSLDHGLEPPEERVAAGKSPRGTLRLRAEQRGDRVLVSVSDDGRGLAAEKIRAKAIRNCLLAPDAKPTESELFQLIFLPGFSTADTVSLVSGRGVGLDVVRRQVEQLRGKVDIRSTRGQGAEFLLSMPLTLAIIEGLMVEVDGDRYILPLSIARETIELTAAQRRAGNGRNVVSLRGDLVPYLRLRDLFGFTTETPDPERVIIVEHEDQRLGLVVDRVIGNHQTVLKSLGWLGREVQAFSGATVLGDGRVALILDVPALLQLRSRQNGKGQGMET